MDFKKLLSTFDAVENDTSIDGTQRKAAAGSMRAILESFGNATKDNLNEADKPDFLDIDKDGDKKESMKKAAKDKEESVDEAVEEIEEELEEVVVEEELEEAIMVSAEGDEAAQLLSILQLAGMPAPAPIEPAPAPMEPEMGPMEPEMEMQDEYSNSPDEFEQDVDAVIASGDDMHREKDQYAAAQDGDNPMKAFEGKFKAIMNDLLAEDEK